MEKFDLRFKKSFEIGEQISIPKTPSVPLSTNFVKD